jgi:AraC-like DNA-binding protein
MLRAYGIGRGSACRIATRSFQFASPETIRRIRARRPLERGEAKLLPQVRAAALINYFEVARFVDLDPHEMLRRAGISPESFADPEAMIAGPPVGALFEESARESGCLSFGLLMAECRTLSSLGPLSLLLKHQGTAREAIEALIRYQGLLSEALALGIEDIDGTSIVHADFVAGLSLRQAVELVMGLFCRTISEVVGGRWHPETAHFLHAAPADLAVHRRVFQCTLVFESEFNGFACPTAWLDAPNPAAESVMARHARRYLDMLVPDPADGTTSERARRALYLLLPAGRGTLEQAADTLGLHPRTLQRLLDKEGRTFAMLLNEVRRELALRYLSSSTHSVTAIAQMIGYASPSSFSRWFTAEFGMAPAQWRAEERQVEGVAGVS